MIVNEQVRDGSECIMRVSVMDRPRQHVMQLLHPTVNIYKHTYTSMREARTVPEEGGDGGVLVDKVHQLGDGPHLGPGFGGGRVSLGDVAEEGVVEACCVMYGGMSWGRWGRSDSQYKAETIHTTRLRPRPYTQTPTHILHTTHDTDRCTPAWRRRPAGPPPPSGRPLARA